MVFDQNRPLARDLSYVQSIMWNDQESCLVMILIGFLYLAHAANLDENMVSPWDKEEYKNAMKWQEKAKGQLLDVVPCVAAWMDVCGFGAALEKNSWDLVSLQKSGTLTMLSQVYQRAAHPFLIGVDPMPCEIVLVINDGIARTVDLGRPEIASAGQIVFYLRDLFFSHNQLLALTKKHECSIRTVLAGGERVQYSPETFTGHSVLQHDEKNISDFGRRLLEKNFVYNPSEFQLNTAFAKAYSLDALGGKHGFKVDNLYIESSFWERLRSIPLLDIEIKDGSILVLCNNLPALEFYFGEEVESNFKGLDLKVNQITAMRVDACFEGEETYCDLGKF